MEFFPLNTNKPMLFLCDAEERNELKRSTARNLNTKGLKCKNRLAMSESIWKKAASSQILRMEIFHNLRRCEGIYFFCYQLNFSRLHLLLKYGSSPFL